MRSVLQELVVEKAVPVLGICVGMQMLANRSEEGTLAGLGWIPGDVRRLDGDLFPGERRLPHMGWNDVTPRRVDSIFRGLERESRFYFLHSYYFAPSYTEDTLAETDYNGLFTSSVCRGNVYGVQFHPEKSHHWGIQLLKNFSEI
jgi:glutamine amidotransferase